MCVCVCCDSSAKTALTARRQLRELLDSRHCSLRFVAVPFFGRLGRGIANVRNVNCALLVRTFCIHVQNFHELRSVGDLKSRAKRNSETETAIEIEDSRVGSAA